MHMVDQFQMPQNNGTPAQCAMFADLGTAGHPHTASHGSVGTHAHVVPNLHQVVELDALFNERVLQGAAIDAGVGTNFDPISYENASELLNLDPLAGLGRETKSIGSNDRA